MNNKKIMRKHMEGRFGNVNHFTEFPPLPASLNIELNNTCNQKCVFCDYHGEYALNPPKPAVMEVEFAKKLIAHAAKSGVGQKELGLYLAGEPFLYKHLVDIIRFSKNEGFKYVFLTTNGTLMDKDIVAEVLDAGIDSIRISLNAVDRCTYQIIHGTDDFDTVVENIKYLDYYRKINKNEVSISVSSVVTNKTKNCIDKVELLLGDYVDDIIYLPLVINRHKNKKELVEKYGLEIDESDCREKQGSPCSLLFDSMYINAEKKVLLCCNAYDTKHYIWDIEENMDFKQAWYSDDFKRHRESFLNGSYGKGTICENCVFSYKRPKDVKETIEY